MVAGTHTGGAQGRIQEACDLLDVRATDKSVEGGREDGVDEEWEVGLSPLFRRFAVE